MQPCIKWGLLTTVQLLSIAYRTKQVTKLEKHNGPMNMKMAVDKKGQVIIQIIVMLILITCANLCQQKFDDLHNIVVIDLKKMLRWLQGSLPF